MTKKYVPDIELSIHGDDKQRIYKFPNGYGASVVRHWFSCGRENGLWELAVIVIDNPHIWKMTYDTPITDDVLGRLTENMVEEILAQIEALPSREG